MNSLTARWRRAAAAVVVLLVAGIVTLGTSAAEAGPIHGAIRGPAVGVTGGAAVRVVEQYVAALARDDLDAAFSLRCQAFRPRDDEHGLFLDQLHRLEAEVGELEGVRARRVARTGLEPASDLPRPVEVEYRIVAGGEVHDPLLAVTVVEDGERRICGVAAPAAARLYRAAPEHVEAKPTVTSDPRVLASPDCLVGETLTEDRLIDPSRGPRGTVDGWTRAWQRADYGGSRVSVIELRSRARALAVVPEEIHKATGDAVAGFSVPGVRGAFGVRVIGMSWLLVQPPDAGPYVDLAWAVYGRDLVWAAVANLPEGASHRAITELMRRVQAKTRET